MTRTSAEVRRVRAASRTPRSLVAGAAVAIGALAMAALRDPSGPRASTTTRCARLYAAVHGGTAFTTAGDSYVTRNFTARTYITTVGRPNSSVDLERFRLTLDGHTVAPIDRNYWGVTFAADDDRFYATVAFGGRTWLVRGDLRARTVTTVHDNAECPSLSPDGRTLVYKKRYDANRQHWRLTALDLRSRRETPLAETRSIDDQVEWLDDAHVLYEVPRSGKDAGRSDVWTVPADGTGPARLLIPLASSPAVLR